jgi:hypothetical protein
MRGARREAARTARSASRGAGGFIGWSRTRFSPTAASLDHLTAMSIDRVGHLMVPADPWLSPAVVADLGDERRRPDHILEHHRHQ